MSPKNLFSGGVLSNNFFLELYLIRSSSGYHIWLRKMPPRPARRKPSISSIRQCKLCDQASPRCATKNPVNSVSWFPSMKYVFGHKEPSSSGRDREGVWSPTKMIASASRPAGMMCENSPWQSPQKRMRGMGLSESRSRCMSRVCSCHDAGCPRYRDGVPERGGHVVGPIAASKLEQCGTRAIKPSWPKSFPLAHPFVLRNPSAQTFSATR